MFKIGLKNIIFFCFGIIAIYKSIFYCEHNFFYYVGPQGEVGGYHSRGIVPSKRGLFGLYYWSRGRSVEGAVQEPDGSHAFSARYHYRVEGFEAHVSYYFLLLSFSFCENIIFVTLI